MSSILELDSRFHTNKGKNKAHFMMDTCFSNPNNLFYCISLQQTSQNLSLNGFWWVGLLCSTRNFFMCFLVIVVGRILVFFFLFPSSAIIFRPAVFSSGCAQLFVAKVRG